MHLRKLHVLRPERVWHLSLVLLEDREEVLLNDIVENYTEDVPIQDCLLDRSFLLIHSGLTLQSGQCCEVWLSLIDQDLGSMHHQTSLHRQNRLHLLSGEGVALLIHLLQVWFHVLEH